MLVTVFSYIKTIRLLPHLLVFYTSKQKELMKYERDIWLKEYRLSKRGLRGLLLLLNSLPEYRSLFYFRTGNKWLSVFAKGQNNLEFYTPSENIGRGLMIWHGFSTVINVRKMGEDCQVWQNVTIGKRKPHSDVDDRPIIGNGVKIAAGAVVVGDITVGDFATIGAASIANRDVPSGTLVVSQSSRYIIK